MKNKTLLPILSIFVFLVTSVEAQVPPAQQQAGGVQARQTLQDNEQKLREGIQKERTVAPIEKPKTPEAAQVPEGEKVKITKIEVTGVTILSAKEIRAVVAGYENKAISLREMQEVANKITDIYRQRGFITSRAVLPPQKVENGILKINVIEGKMGKVEVQGNKYFKTSLIKRKIELKSGEPFDYNKLKNNLSVLNQVQDRKVKTVLTPGKEPGTTDLVLDVKDQLPIHVGMAYDNYGSRYLRKNRYQGSITDNNLTGNDDIMTLTYQRAEGHDTYRMDSVRYLYPLSSKTQLGFYAGETELRLGKEFKDLVARGKSKIYSVYLTHSLFTNDTTEVGLETGFDYKNVFNFQNNVESSRDCLRVARAGLKVDRSDTLGRTIINNEVDQGIPNQWGSLGSKESGFLTSRAGAGGLYTKDVLDVLRLQRMPFSSTLLLKGQTQLASHVLTATEQYQLGGISNLRGFPAGEAVGDNGGSGTAELSFPVYGMPKNINAPFSKGKLYDCLRIAAFYDYGKVTLRRPGTGEQKTRELDDYGWGIRYDLPENFSVRLDFARPLDQTPSDNKASHTWIKVSKDF